jgi:hypothetical protein
MKVLHIVKSKPTGLTKKIIEEQSKKHEVKVINLRKKDISYEDVIDDIFSHDKIFSW